MHSIFENKYEVNKEVMMDWGRHPLSKGQQRVQTGFRILWLVFAVFCLFNLISAFMAQAGAFVFFYSILLVFCLYRVLWRNKLVIGKQYQILSKAQGQPSWERTIRLDDKIRVYDGNNSSEFQYSQVTGTVEDSRYIALLLGTGQGIRLEKDAFTMGNAQELSEFVRHQKFLYAEDTVRETVVIDGETYEFAQNIRGDEKIRGSFFELASQVFGLDFEQWYQNGWWRGAYRPNVLIRDGRVVANVSVNPMVFVVDGQERHYIQLGTVMTAPEFRKKGLSRYLMERVLGEWRDRCDLIYLFANSSVLNFYPRFGFERKTEYAFWRAFPVEETPALGGKREFRNLNMRLESDRRLLIDKAAAASPVARLQNWKETGLLMFYCDGPMAEHIYYSDKRDMVLIGKQEGESLLLYEAFAGNDVNDTAIWKAAQALAGEIGSGQIRNLRTAFAPLCADGFLTKACRDDDEALFVMGEDAGMFDGERLEFPEMSRA